MENKLKKTQLTNSRSLPNKEFPKFFFFFKLSSSQLSPKALDDSTRKISTQPTNKIF